MSAAPPTLPAARADEVLALVRDLARPLEPERVPLDEALGRVLREPVRAPADQPAFDRSAVDGFAVRADDPGPTFRLVDEIRAGDWKPRRLQPGEAVRIATGGALPDEGLQVVMKEDATVTADGVRFTRRDSAGNIRCRGEDARAGQVLVEPGTVLQPGALGLLASVGCARPLVSRRPRVLHAVTGNELVPPEQTPGPGQIRDSNSTLIRAFLRQWGIVPTHLRLPEDEAGATSALQHPRANLEAVDLLLVSGGASVGEHDFTRRLLEHLGYTVRVSKTTARPGKPMILAHRGAALAFGLPGNPLAHFVCLNLYVRAALAAFAGLEPAPATLGELDTGLDADGDGRETFWPARARIRDGRVRLTPLRWASSGDLTALATANALIRVPAGTDRLAPGSEVEFISTSPSV